MDHRQVIAEAWVFTQENKRMIVWYAFIPSILTTLVGVLYLLYQFYSFKSSVFFENWQESFTAVVLKELYKMALEYTDSLFPILILLVVLALMYFLLPPLTEGAMIQLIARRKNRQEVRIRDGLRFGFSCFLPLFEYSWIARSFNFIMVIGEIGLLVRLLGPNASQTLMPVFLLILLVSLIFQVLFLFAEYYIVIDSSSIKLAMSQSASLVVKNWDTSFVLMFFMMVIAVRILIQIIFVLVVPIGLVTFLYFLASETLPIGGLLVGGILSFAALLFASYLGAIVHVFTSSVWVFSFLELTNTPEVSAREKADGSPS